jgi:hypothetical protein
MKKLFLISALATATMAQAQQLKSDTLASKGTIRIQITKEINGKVIQTDTTFDVGEEQAASLYISRNGMERQIKTMIKLNDDDDTGRIESQEFTFVMPPSVPLPPDALRHYSFSYSDDDMERIIEKAEELLKEHSIDDRERRNIIRKIEVRPDSDQRRKMKKSKKKRIIIIEEA